MTNDNDGDLLRRFARLIETRNSAASAMETMYSDQNLAGEESFLVHKVTPESCLQAMYSELPGRFPALFEKMLLTYRWGGLDTGIERIFANPPTDSLLEFRDAILEDEGLISILFPARMLPFGHGTEGDYDPICFALGSSDLETDGPTVVKLDHEEILCFGRVRVVADVATSFRDLLVRRCESA